MPKPLQLQLFGTPQIFYLGQPLTGFVSGKVRALLIYLAVTARPQSRTHLAELLWADTPASSRVNLRKALSNLRQLLGDVLLEDGKESVALDLQYAWVDVIEFAQLVKQEREPEAIQLYHADFLSGFNFSLSYDFEAWALSEQSRLKTQYVDLLRCLATQQEANHKLSEAIATVRHLLALEPWHEEAHRWLMELLARDGQRSAALAHFEVCGKALREELDVDPNGETQILYRRLCEETQLSSPEREGWKNLIEYRLIQPKTKSITHPSNDLSHSPQEVPHFLQCDLSLSIPQESFIARETELNQLNRLLEQMLAGQGLVTFVTGEAGSGKTTLLREFVQQALVKHGNLIAATGNCNAYGGFGDPYLPFREIMALLTGDVEACWRAGGIGNEQAHRLWGVTPTVTQALLQHGVSLIDIFLSSTALYERTLSATNGEPPWLAQLETLVEQHNIQQKQPVIDQSALFEMYTKVLQTVAQHHPLILILEDMHWSDFGSISLLFHLGRRLPGQRILVIGLYRPHDLAVITTTSSTSEIERHPLEMLVHEFQQIFGEKPLDLGKADGKHFVESLLDMEPNRLSTQFRANLFQHTQGHALFTTEILRAMQQRNDLVHDTDGCWVVGKTIDWSQLPSRVEGVISERIERLPSHLRELVKVASIMGEEFIAEVVARILKLDERTIVRQLGTLLNRQHDLVQSQGTRWFGEQRLSFYRFRHILFQHYLYQTTDPGERLYLHEDIGTTLEHYYHGQTEQVAVQLALHFRKAGLTSKALEYLQKAAEQANKRLAFREAIGFFDNALALIREQSATEKWKKLQTRLQLALAEAQYKTGQIAESLQSFQQAADIAISYKWAEDLAEAALGYEQVRYRFSLSVEPSIKLLQSALAFMAEGENLLKVQIFGQLAQALFFATETEQATQLSAQAIEIARRMNDPQTLFDVLYVPTMANRRPESTQARLADIDELLKLSHLLKDQVREMHVYAVSIIDHLQFGDIDVVDDVIECHAKLSVELNQAFLKFISFVLRSTRATLAGDYSSGEELAQQARVMGQSIQVDNTDGIYGILMFTIRREQGGLNQLAPIIENFIQRNPDSAVWRPGLALIYCDLEMIENARVQFEKLAADNFATVPQDALWVGSITYLAEVCSFLQDKNRAAQLYEHLLPYADSIVVVGFGIACLGAAAHYLGMLATTLEQWDDAERYFGVALRLNMQIKSHPRLAHTQVQYAAMLLTRNRTGDRSSAVALLNAALNIIEALDMKFLAGKVEVIRQKYFFRIST